MNAKHQFKYTYNETDYEEFSPLEVTFEMPAEVNLTQMLNNFEQYLRACGFFFDGKLAIVEDGYDIIDDLEEEPQGGCMADFDKECGCEDTSSPLEPKNGCMPNWDGFIKAYNDKKLKEWNEGIAKLDNEEKMKCYEEALKMSEPPSQCKQDNEEVKKNKWVHGICNPPSPDWKKNK